jgi:hypothetical protein
MPCIQPGGEEGLERVFLSQTQDEVGGVLGGKAQQCMEFYITFYDAVLIFGL